jgi:acetyl-CoA acetyltransferase
MFPDVEIPYGAYWSTPFVRWQGTFQHLNAFQFAAWVARNELDKRSIDKSSIHTTMVGNTIAQHHSFYGAPWVAGLAGLATGSTGPTMNQACATGTRLLIGAAQEVQCGLTEVSLLIATDRTSNGPHVYYPQPRGVGGTGSSENLVIDNFSCDPLGGHAMLDTAENVARKHVISTTQQHEVVLRRLEQYGDALSNGHAFQKRFMSLPFDVPSPDFKKTDGSVTSDEGVFQSTLEGITRLKPVKPGGTVTFGGQTHPADGNTGMIVASRDRCTEYSSDPSIKIAILGFGQARVEIGYMPEATIPAAMQALKNADVPVGELAAIKTHNPFALNDIVLSNALHYPLEKMNNFGCSLVWGHPHAATALRSIIELIEELVARGGGIGLFAGCAAGDSGLATVIKVSSK